MCLTTNAPNQAPVNHPNYYSPYDDENTTQWWTTKIDGEQKLQAADKGLASYGKTPVTTLCALFKDAKNRNGNKPALRYEELKVSPNTEETEEIMSVPKNALEAIEAPPYLKLKRWKTVTWNEYYAKSERFGLANVFLGLKQHTRIAIIGSNHPYFAMSFMGSLLCGCIPAPLDPDDTREALLAKLQLVQPRIVVLSSLQALKTLKKHIDMFTEVLAIVTWNLPPSKDLQREDGTPIKVYTFIDFLSLGQSFNADILGKQTSKVLAQHCCSIIFTSGVANDPKPCMLSHDNFHYSAAVNLDVMKIGKKKKQYKFFSYLPLSCASFLLYDIVCPIVISANLSFRGWGVTHFAREDDVENGLLLYRVRAVRPVLFVGTARLWIELKEAIEDGIETRSNFYKNLLEKSRNKSKLATKARQLGSTEPLGMTSFLSLYFSKQFLTSFKKYLGLNKAKYLLCKEDTLTSKTLDFFDELQLRVNESYGLTETTGLGFMNSNNFFLPGSCGYECPGMEIKLFKQNSQEEVPDICRDLVNPKPESLGEIFIRGRAVFMGYYNGDTETSQCFSSNGFFSTGDLAAVNEKGMFRIAGRVDELVNGVAPEPIENFIKELTPLINDAVVLSHKKKVNILLLTLKNSDFPSDHQIAEIRRLIELTNSTREIIKTKQVSIHKFTILPRPFSVNSGELSSNLKLKRRSILEIYEPIIAAMYHEADFYVDYKVAPTENLAQGTETVINAWTTGDRKTIFAQSSTY